MCQYEKARTGMKPDTRHLEPMLREGFITPDNAQKRDLFFYHFAITNLPVKIF